MTRSVSRRLARSVGRRTPRLWSVGFDALEARTLLSVGIVKDINQLDAQPSDLTAAGSELYFTANDPATNSSALWATNTSTNATAMVADYPSGAPSQFVALGSSVYFISSDSGMGSVGLYTSSGAAGGITKVASLTGTNSYISNAMAAANGLVFFVLDNSTTGEQLYESNGTSAGTVEVPGTSQITSFSSLTSAGSKLFFTYDQFAAGTSSAQLWAVDGTSNGTRMLASVSSGSISGLQAIAASEVGFYESSPTQGEGLWLSSGTTATTQQVVTGVGVAILSAGDPLAMLNGDLFFVGESFGGLGFQSELFETTPGTGSSTQLTTASFAGSLENFTVVGGKLLFSAADQTHGNELWSSDGTVQGTGLVKDINPGSAGSIEQSGTLSNYSTPFAVAGGLAYFAANDGVHGQELWQSDGTSANTLLVKDIDPGSTSASPQDVVSLGSAVYFAAHDGDGSNQLWSSNSSGSTLVQSFSPGQTKDSNPIGLTAGPNGLLLFLANDGIDGEQLFATDGTNAGTNALFTFTGQYVFYGSTPIVSLGSSALFVAPGSGGSSSSLEVTDGTVAGTKSIYSGSIIEGSLFKVGQEAYFAVYEYNSSTSQSFLELFRTDGTSANTVDIGPVVVTGEYDQAYEKPVDASGRFYFEVVSSTDNYIWMSDPTLGQTIQLADFPISQYPGGPQNFTALGQDLLFTTNDLAGGGESLWSTNGTVSGTAVLKDFTGSAYTSPPTLSSLTTAGASVFFTVDEPNGGVQLWASNGTSSGTLKAHDFPGVSNGGYYQGGVAQLTASNGLLYFIESSSTTGDSQLWTSSGSAGGTKMIHDFGVSYYGPKGLTDVNGVLEFMAVDSAVSTTAQSVEAVWKSNGTSAGTTIVADLPSLPSTGTGGYSYVYSYSQNFMSADGSLFFTNSVNNPSGSGNVVSLWESGGTAASTAEIATGLPLTSYGPSSNALTPSGGSFFFTATNNDGKELWAASNLSLQPNSPPTLAAIPNQSIAPGATLSLTVAGLAPNGDQGFYELSQTTSTNASIDASTGAISWSVPSNQATTNYSFTVYFVDAATLLSASQTFTVDVTTGTPPTINSIPAKTINDGQTLSFTASGSAPNNDPVAWSLVGAPVGATINSTSGVFSWAVPANETGGASNFTVVITDTVTQLTADQVVDVTVYAPPKFNTIAPQDVEPGTTLSFSAAASESDAGALSYSILSGGQPGMSINSSSGLFTWIVSTSQSLGSFSPTIQATDSLSNLTSTVVVAINVTQAPVIAPVAAQTVDVGSALTFTVSATDSDGGSLSYSLATGAPRAPRSTRALAFSLGLAPIL